MSLIYGEVKFEVLSEVFLKSILLPPGGVFVDLGSGVGRAVFAAAMLHDFKKCVGIEILQSLFEESQQILAQWKARTCI